MSDRKKKHRTTGDYDVRTRRLKDPNRWKFDPNKYVKDEECEYYEDDETQDEEDTQHPRK